MRNQYQPLAAGGPPDAALHRRLDALIRRHLPGVTASLLAEPVPTADGRFVEWYSDLSGQPIPLASLSAADRAAVGCRPRRPPAFAHRPCRSPRPNGDAGGEAELGQALRQALSYPGEATVYVVDGQPVLIFWGYQPLHAPAAAGPLAPAATAPEMLPETAAPGGGPATMGRRLPRWLAPLAGVLALAAIAVGLFASGLVRWPPWGPDYARC